MTSALTPTEREELEALLPWYAAGTLTPEETRRVEAALASDTSLRASLATVEEDREAVRMLNVALPGPSPRALDRIMAAAAATPRRPGLLARIRRWVSGSDTQGLPAWAGMAALAVIVVQAGAVAILASRPAGTTYTTASAPDERGGPEVLVVFAPGATMAQVGAALDAVGARIVDGPQAGGLWRVRLGPAGLSPADVAARLERLRDRSGVAVTVVPMPDPPR